MFLRMPQNFQLFSNLKIDTHSSSVEKPIDLPKSKSIINLNKLMNK